MKIITQTDSEMLLKEGSGFNYVFSVGFMFFGIAMGYMMSRADTPHGIAYIFPIILFFVGLLWFLFVPSIMLNINKISGQIIYQKKRIMGTKISNYAITDVSSVETRKNWQVVNVKNQRQQGFSVSPRFQLIIQSFLILKDGIKLNLESGHNIVQRSSTVNSSNFFTEDEVSTAKRVANFLGVSFKEIEPPSVGGMTGPGIVS